MSFSHNYSNNLKQILNLPLSITLLSFSLVLLPSLAYSEETAKSSLPTAPNTGTPEEDFSAGGTRNNRQLATICRENSQQISYLLGKNNREFTLNSHPTFWFYIPHNLTNIENLEFILTDVATGKKIYNRSVSIPKQESLVGLPLPLENKYALATNENYSWQLKIKCTEPDQDAETTLKGWVNRLSLAPEIQSQLTTVDKLEKYQVYLAEDLYYDALDNLLQLKLVESNNPDIQTAWSQMLVNLGWQSIAEKSSINSYVISD